MIILVHKHAAHVMQTFGVGYFMDSSEVGILWHLVVLSYYAGNVVHACVLSQTVQEQKYFLHCTC